MSATTITRAAAPADAVPLRTWIAVAAAILGVFMAVLDTQITNASLPEILGSLSISRDEGSWMSTAYLAAEVVVIPLTGFFVGVFGVRAYMLGNVALFLLFSTLCGYAWNLPSMIVFRTLQGFTGGALIPTAMTLLITRLPPARRPVALAWFILSSTLAPTFGPTLGGFLTETYSWPAIFFINWVPGVLMFGGIAYGLAVEPKRLPLLLETDWLAIGAMAVGLGSLIVFLEQGERNEWFDSDFIQACFLLTCLGIATWVAILLVRAKPFINVRLFARRTFAVSSVVGAAAGAGLFGSTFVLPQFLAQIAGYNSLQIGRVIMWMGLPQILVMPLAAKYAKKLDNRIICSLGLVLFAVSCFMNSTMDATTTGDQLVASQVFRALGQPLIIITLTNFAIHRVEPPNLSSASSLYNMSRVLGGAIGTAVLATVITTREHVHSAAIGEHVSLFAAPTQDRLAQLTSMFLPRSADLGEATQRGTAALQMLVRREAFVMGYNDSFFLLGGMLLLAAGLIWLADRVIAGGK